MVFPLLRPVDGYYNSYAGWIDLSNHLYFITAECLSLYYVLKLLISIIPLSLIDSAR